MHYWVHSQYKNAKHVKYLLWIYLIALVYKLVKRMVIRMFTTFLYKYSAYEQLTVHLVKTQVPRYCRVACAEINLGAWFLLQSWFLLMHRLRYCGYRCWNNMVAQAILDLICDQLTLWSAFVAVQRPRFEPFRMQQYFFHLAKSYLVFDEPKCNDFFKFMSIIIDSNVVMHVNI